VWATLEDLGAQFQTSWVVQIQHADSGAAGGVAAINPNTFDSEMVGPSIMARVKKLRDLSCVRVDSGQIGSLAQVATVACKRQVVRIVGTAVLLCDDVFHMMLQFAVLLAQTAVFAALVSTVTHELPRCLIHLLLD
jgi:ABC-type Co2+ transport system permease subunit